MLKAFIFLYIYAIVILAGYSVTVARVHGVDLVWVQIPISRQNKNARTRGVLYYLNKSIAFNKFFTPLHNPAVRLCKTEVTGPVKIGA